MQLYETTQEHKGTILTLQEKLESIERLEDANNQNVLLITEEGLFSKRAFFFFRDRVKERGLIDRGPIRQGTILVKGTCLREGLIKVGGLLNRGSLFRVEPIRGGGAY